MLELMNIGFSYLCRATRQNEEGQPPIVLRVSFRGERRDIFTGLYCNSSNWQAEYNRVSKREAKATAINSNLDLILRKANHAFDELRFSGNGFTIDELIDKIKGKESKPTLLIDFLEEGNKKVKKKVGIDMTLKTYWKYRRGLEYMKEFLQSEFKVKNFSLLKVNREFMESYFQFLRSEKKLAYNSACKYFSCVKTIFLPAINTGEIKTNPFYGLKINPKKVHKQFLTQCEIDKLVKVKLESPELNLKRDIFLFACYTGLAYIDIRQLSSSHIVKEANNAWHIRKPRQKTDEESIIPLLPAAFKILKKYTPTGDITDLGWYICSNQKMNKGLKIIGKKAGLSKELHMHLARYTFATTVTLMNGVPIESVSKMLGHASIKQTQEYAKVIPLKIKGDMEKIMGMYK